MGHPLAHWSSSFKVPHCAITILKSSILCAQLTLVFISYWALQMIQLVLIPADSHLYVGAGKMAVS